MSDSYKELISKVDMLSKAVVSPDAPFLGDLDVEYAASSLNKPIFSQVVRAKNDPRISGQEIGLFSFTPSAGAQPDKYGVFGVAKLRGNFATPKKAASSAENIIRTVDSVNEIYHVRVGETFPLTKEPKWTDKFDSIDLRKRADTIQKEKENEVREEDARETKTILDREKRLLDENKEIAEGTYKEDPLDVYTRLRVALAQLKWTKEDTERKVSEEIVPAIKRKVVEISKMDIEDDTYDTLFLEKYMKARTDASLSNEISEDDSRTQQGFLKYLLSKDV